MRGPDELTTIAVNKVQSSDRNLGELHSVHRPSTLRIWLMSLIGLTLLSVIALVVILTIESLTSSSQSKGGFFDRLLTPLGCAGVMGLLFALVFSFLLRDFRKWLATRTVALRIYQDGLTYESKGQMEACSWTEIKDITHRRIEVSSKHSPPRRVNVIRSIIKADGTFISFADTLNLRKITTLINAARNGPRSGR